MEIFIIVFAVIIGFAAFFIGKEYSRRKQAARDGVELKITGKNMPLPAKIVLLLFSFSFLAFCVYYFLKAY